MLGPLSQSRVLRYAGLFTWAMVGVPLIYSQYHPPSGDELEAAVGVVHTGSLLACYLGFGLCYFWLTQARVRVHAQWYDRLLLILMSLAALGVSYFNASGLGSILLMVAAGAIPWLLPLPLGGPLLLLSQLAVLPIYYVAFQMPLFEAVMQSLLYGGFSMFIFVTSLVAKQQAEARDEQRRLNAELRATRALLAESARVNERTRISRELHDLLGHHLTALSLNLEVASHLTEGVAQEHVRQSHTLARLLLGDVREAVSQLREGGSIDLAAALLPLAEPMPTLAIHLDMEAPMNVDDPERAHVLLRCTQEVITNAARHGGARNLWLAVRREAGRIVLEARDDGHGAADVVPGNGLRGMCERVEALGGELIIDGGRGPGGRGTGFHLTAWVPATGTPLATFAHIASTDALVPSFEGSST